MLIFEISGFRVLDQFWKDFLTKPIIFTNFQASAARFLISRAQMEEFSRETFRKPPHDVYGPLGVDRTGRQTPICDLQREKTSPDPFSRGSLQNQPSIRSCYFDFSTSNHFPNFQKFIANPIF